MIVRLGQRDPCRCIAEEEGDDGNKAEQGPAMVTALELRCTPLQAAQAPSSSGRGELRRAPATAPDGELSRAPAARAGGLTPFPARPRPSSREHAAARRPFSTPAGTNCVGRWVPALRNTAGVAAVLQQGSLLSPLRINSICRCRCKILLELV
jgi:hypothetical protein